MAFEEEKREAENVFIPVRGVNVNPEIMKEYLWDSYVTGKSLSVTAKVAHLETTLNKVLEWAGKLQLTAEQRLELNDFRI